MKVATFSEIGVDGKNCLFIFGLWPPTHGGVTFSEIMDKRKLYAVLLQDQGS